MNDKFGITSEEEGVQNLELTPDPKLIIVSGSNEDQNKIEEVVSLISSEYSARGLPELFADIIVNELEDPTVIDDFALTAELLTAIGYILQEHYRKAPSILGLSNFGFVPILFAGEMLRQYGLECLVIHLESSKDSDTSSLNPDILIKSTEDTKKKIESLFPKIEKVVRTLHLPKEAVDNFGPIRLSAGFFPSGEVVRPEINEEVMITSSDGKFCGHGVVFSSQEYRHTKLPRILQLTAGVDLKKGHEFTSRKLTGISVIPKLAWNSLTPEQREALIEKRFKVEDPYLRELVMERAFWEAIKQGLSLEEWIDDVLKPDGFIDLSATADEEWPQGNNIIGLYEKLDAVRGLVISAGLPTREKVADWFMYDPKGFVELVRRRVEWSIQFQHLVLGIPLAHAINPKKKP